MIEKVILHIGLHKAGTTSFQFAIFDCIDALKKRSIELYRPVAFFGGQRGQCCGRTKRGVR